MKIISWNVNGIRAVERKGDLQGFLETRDPDLFLLQEIKGNREQFSAFLTEHPDYDQYYHSAEKKGYSGTGVWVRKSLDLKDVTFHTNVPHAPNADEGRIAHVSFTHEDKEWDVFSIYFPNGGKSEEAWRDKIVFYDRVLAYMNDLHQQGRHVVVGGDMNVAHTAIDLARSKENDGKIGFHPEERAWVDRVIASGWVDAYRALYPEQEDVYSWWDMVTRARERNVGWRIDYFFLRSELVPQIKKIGYLSDQYGSDHCPISLEITM